MMMCFYNPHRNLLRLPLTQLLWSRQMDTGNQVQYVVTLSHTYVPLMTDSLSLLIYSTPHTHTHSPSHHTHTHTPPPTPHTHTSPPTTHTHTPPPTIRYYTCTLTTPYPLHSPRDDYDAQRAVDTFFSQKIILPSPWPVSRHQAKQTYPPGDSSSPGLTRPSSQKKVTFSPHPPATACE